MTRLIKPAALVLGTALLWGAIREVSWVRLQDLFADAGVLLIFPVLVYPVACVFHALALQALLNPPAKVGFKDIYIVRMIGDSLNKVTPFVDIGGEPLKMALLAERKLTSLSRAVISVWISRVSFVASEVIFVILGWLLLGQMYPKFDLTWVIAAAIVISLISLWLLVAAHMNGALKIAQRLTKYLGADIEDKVWSEADQGLRTFYKSHHRNFLISLLWQFLGWALASLEVYIFFRILGLPIDWAQAFIFQSILQAIKTASFLIPANLGAQEKGLSVLAMHMGYSATDGFALSIIKRFRQFVWVIAGLFLWKWAKKRKV